MRIVDPLAQKGEMIEGSGDAIVQQRRDRRLFELRDERIGMPRSAQVQVETKNGKIVIVIASPCAG
jgi:hypothetical protein